MKLFGRQLKGFSSLPSPSSTLSSLSFPKKKDKKASKKKSNPWTSPNEDARHYLSSLNKHQRAHLGQGLFKHVWRTKGKEAALAILLKPKRKNLDRFNDATQLWIDNQYHLALQEYLRCQEQLEQSTLYPSSEVDLQAKELLIKTHYAIGMCHMSMQNPHLSIPKFFLAWRMSCLIDKRLHIMSQPSKYMMSKALSQWKGRGQASIQMKRMEHAIDLELEGDYCFGLRDYELALDDYEIALDTLLTDTPNIDLHLLLAQAAIRSKLATTFCKMGDYLRARDEFATSLSLYQTVLGPEHVLTQGAFEKFVANNPQYVASQYGHGEERESRDDDNSIALKNRAVEV